MRLALITLCASAFLATACGSNGASSASTAPQPASSAPSAASSKPPSNFEALANTVCRTVRAGAPGPLSTKPSVAGLRRHAIAGGLAAGRTIVSLNRLATQAGDQRSVRRLVSDYEQLRALYGAALAPTLKPKTVGSLAHAVNAAEATTGGDARAIDLPGCAPQPPGV